MSNTHTSQEIDRLTTKALLGSLLCELSGPAVRGSDATKLHGLGAYIILAAMSNSDDLGSIVSRALKAAYHLK